MCNLITIRCTTAQDYDTAAGYPGLVAHDSDVHTFDTRATHAFHGIAQGGATSHLPGLVAVYQERGEALLGEAHFVPLWCWWLEVQTVDCPVVGPSRLYAWVGVAGDWCDFKSCTDNGCKPNDKSCLFAAVRIKAASCGGEDRDAPH